MAEAHIKALTTKRAGAKSSLTSFQKFVNGVTSDSDIEALQRRIEAIEAVNHKFQLYQDELEGLLDESEELFAHRTTFDEDFGNAIGKAKNLLKQYSLQAGNTNIAERGLTGNPTMSSNQERGSTGNPTVPSNQVVGSTGDPTTPSNQQTTELTSAEIQNATADGGCGQNIEISELGTSSSHTAALPAISLPTFDGAFDAWLGFHDLFQSLVHDDVRLPPVRKLFYLKGCLKGEAAEVISALQSSNENYAEAWKLLKDRYDDRKFIRNSHIKAVMYIKPISKEFSVRAFLDTTQKHLRALQALGQPVESWSAILVVCLCEKLGPTNLERWEDYSIGLPDPTIDDLIEFLKKRAQLEGVRAQHSSNKQERPATKHNRTQQAFMTSSHNPTCIYCNGKDHKIYTCSKFASLVPASRYEVARRGSWCINCLQKGHKYYACKSRSCHECNQKHHTLLHFPRPTDQATGDTEVIVNMQTQVTSQALLATALVDLINNQGKTKTCRVFLDAGSQAHFITEEAARYLNLTQKPSDVYVTGIDNVTTKVKFSARAILRSRFSKYEKAIDLLIVPTISQAVPSIAINPTRLEIPKNIKLADPEFFQPAPVDVLIGVKLFYKLLSIGQISLKGHPNAILQKTQLGWIIAGEVSYVPHASRSYCHVAIQSQPSDVNLTRFWELEEIPASPVLSLEETTCEQHYEANTTRAPDGRYEVRLPFNNKKPMLGESYSIALKRFHGVERKLQRNPEMQQEYINFLEEYLALGHMSLADDQDSKNKGCFLPHHAVVKEGSLTTKIRVVFDASAKTSTRVSLNDTLLVGPKLQDDLFIILLRFRSHIYVLTADVEKMYRQVRVNEDDAGYQKILYRKTTSEPIRSYVLNTVTYGTASASYLAIKTLYQLADDEQQNFPLGAPILRNDFYVDDLLTGANSVAQALLMRDELINLLKRGGFHLRKWASNHPSLLINNEEHPHSSHLSLDPDASIKTLGIHWNAREDYFFYTVHITQKATSKRTILSQIARLFDPLGLLAPIIVYAKILIQELWKIGLSWDESVPQSINSSWACFQEQLPLIEKLRFSRGVTISNPVRAELHGFCDASEKAYGACLYLRSIDSQGQISIHLVAAKSRVAPVRPVTLPRLELSAALLLARLYRTIMPTMLTKIHESYLWSDAMIVLHWINTSAHKLKTFVANRIAEIQAITETCHWRHVPSESNPADIISRGQLPSEFVESNIWFNGPAWLQKSNTDWPNKSLMTIEVPELKLIIPKVACLKIEIKQYNLLEKYSSFNKLQRVVAYLMRFIHNTKQSSNRMVGSLSTIEITKAHDLIIHFVQVSAFKRDIETIQKEGELPTNSKIRPLKPLIDKCGILRVGGRISNAIIPEEQRHPIVLPSQHHVTKLIIQEEHQRLKHAGMQATLYAVRQKYWPINGRGITRGIIHKCITCFRAKPVPAGHSMGVLPIQRVTAARPFLHVGVDYCGPFFIKERRRHNRIRIKVYVAVYVCLCTKAVHLELVGDLTTEAFLGSLRRLFARRGKAAEIHSDNGTNFIGAKHELNALFSSREHQAAVTRFCQDEKIIWRLIPPRLPHFGGIWEAAVKSFKHHLKRIVGDTLLTFEQLETCIIEIEAVLNSRPISPMSEDPSDLLPLTPAHMLIGSPLTSYPETQLTEVPANRLSAWQHAQQLKQHFWARWHKEYLQNLIKFGKTTGRPNNLKMGDLVMIMDNNLPSLKWASGRITALHPGKDGIVRVVTLKTKDGDFVRGVKKLCPLPIDYDDVTHSN